MQRWTSTLEANTKWCVTATRAPRLDVGNEDPDPVQQGRRIGEFVAAYGRIDIADSIPATGLALAR